LPDTSNRRRFFYGYVVAGAGFFIWFVGWGTFVSSFGVFLKPILGEFGWTRAEASLAYSLSMLVQAIAGLGVGWLTDRLGPKFVVAGLGSLVGVCFLSLSRTQSLSYFYMNWLLFAGIGASAFTVPVMVTLSRWFVKKRNFMIGIVQAGMGLGGLVFPPLAAWLIIAYGWRTAYVVMGIIALTGTLIPGLFFRRDPSEIGQPPDGVGEMKGLTDGDEKLGRRPAHGQREEQGKPSVSGTVPQEPLQEEGLTFRAALRTKPFWIIVGLFSTFGFCRSAFLVHIAAHVQDLGFTLSDGANVLAVIVGASVVSRLGTGRVGNVIGSKAAFVLSFGMTTISLVLGLLAGKLVLLYIFAFLFGFAWGNQAVLRFSITSEIFGLASLGVLTGAFYFAESLAATFGAYYAGFVFDVMGGYSFVFVTGIATSLTGTLLAAYLLMSSPKTAI
jgi:MFS family permease